eukprot:sb/3464423/
MESKDPILKKKKVFDMTSDLYGSRTSLCQQHHWNSNNHPAQMGAGSYNVGAMHGQVYFGDPYQYQRYMEMRHAVTPFPGMNHVHQQQMQGTQQHFQTIQQQQYNNHHHTSVPLQRPTPREMSSLILPSTLQPGVGVNPCLAATVPSGLVVKTPVTPPITSPKRPDSLYINLTPPTSIGSQSQVINSGTEYILSPTAEDIENPELVLPELPGTPTRTLPLTPPNNDELDDLFDLMGLPTPQTAPTREERERGAASPPGGPIRSTRSIRKQGNKRNIQRKGKGKSAGSGKGGGELESAQLLQQIVVYPYFKNVRRRQTTRKSFVTSCCVTRLIYFPSNQNSLFRSRDCLSANQGPVYILVTHQFSKQPIRTRYLGHVTGYQPIRGQYCHTSINENWGSSNVRVRILNTKDHDPPPSTTSDPLDPFLTDPLINSSTTQLECMDFGIVPPATTLAATDAIEENIDDFLEGL